MWSCSLSKRSLTAGPDQSIDISDSRRGLLEDDVADRAACHVFVIFQTKRNECEKNFELRKIDFFFMLHKMNDGAVCFIFPADPFYTTP